jgi:hypothetical protein
MAYIGAVAPGYDPTRASVPQLDAERFSGDATTTAFTLTRQVVSPTDIDVIVENVTQEPTVAYSVNGYTLTFTGAPGSGTNNIYVIYRASAVSNYAFVPDGSITYAKLANNIRQFTVDTFTANGTGSTVALTEAPASANSLIVSVDGVIQTAPSNYTLSGSTITFTGVPDSGANVVVKHIGFRTTSTVTALQASSVTATEIADGAITNAKIVSVANTKITGNIVSSQITSVANTQITGNIVSSQITSNPTFYGNVSVTGAIGVGGAAPTTSGSGITFPATQSASSDANTLDDYEEGTFTPIVLGSTVAGTGTYGNQVAQYTKIGNRVSFNLYVTWSNLTGATGNLQVGGLPFTTSALGSNYNVVSTWCDNLTLPASSYLTAYTNLTSTTFSINANIVAGGGAANIAIDTSAGIMFAGSYSI